MCVCVCSQHLLYATMHLRVMKHKVKVCNSKHDGEIIWSTRLGSDTCLKADDRSLRIQKLS